MANTKVTGDLIASSTIATGNIADNAVTSAKISGITTAHITEGSNLYYTDARARAAVSVSGNALSYNSSTGVITSNFEEAPTFTGIVTASRYVATGQNLSHGASRLKISQENTTLSEIRFYGADTSTAGALRFMGSSSDGSTGDVRMTIDSSGRLGIGTISPSHNLHVVSAGNGEIKAERTSGAAMLIQTQSALGRFGTTTNHNLQFMANSNGWMTITTAGNVGIGLTSPAVKLEIQDSTHTTMKVRSGNNDNILFAQALQSDEARIGTDTNSAISFFTNTGRRMTITTSGNVGIGTNLPQSKLHISTSATNAPIRLQNDNGSGSTANYVLQTDSAGLGNNGFGIYDVAQSAYRFVINGSGNVGIGTTSPSHNLEISGVGGDGTPLLQFTGSASATFNWISSAIHANLASGETSVHLFGQAESSKNSGYIGYLYSSSGSDNNAVTIGHFAANYLVNILASGKVGIGTTSPSTKLHISGGDPSIRLTPGGSNDARVDFTDSGGTVRFYTGYDVSSGNFVVTSDESGFGSSNIMVMNDSGNVGIGTTSPSYKLQVSGGDVFTSADKGYIASYNNTTSYHGVLRWSALQLGNNGGNRIIAGRTATGGVLDFYTNNTNNASDYTVTPDGNHVMRMAADGNVGIGTTSPASITSNVHTLTIDGQSSTVSGGFIFKANTANKMSFYWESNNMRYQNIGAYNHVFYASNTSELMRITSGGNVGITNSSPNNKLEISDTGTGTGSTHLKISRGADSSTVSRIAGIKMGNTASNDGSNWIVQAESSLGYFDDADLNFYHNGGGTAVSKFKIKKIGEVISQNHQLGSRGFVLNGVGRVANTGYVNGNATLSITYDCLSQGSFFIQCVFNHYGNISSYGCSRVFTYANGPGGNEQINIQNVTSSSGGSWTITKVSNTRFTIAKTAGTYQGAGYWFVNIVGTGVKYT